MRFVGLKAALDEEARDDPLDKPLEIRALGAGRWVRGEREGEERPSRIQAEGCAGSKPARRSASARPRSSTSAGRNQTKMCTIPEDSDIS